MQAIGESVEAQDATLAEKYKALVKKKETEILMCEEQIEQQRAMLEELEKQEEMVLEELDDDQPWDIPVDELPEGFPMFPEEALE